VLTAARTRIKSVLRLHRAVGMVWSCAPRLTVANVVLMLLQGLLPIATLLVTKEIIDAVTAGLAGTGESGAFAGVAWWISAAAALALAGAALGAISSVVSSAQAQTVTDYVSDLLHAKSVEVDLEYYENPRYHDTMHRAQQTAPFLPTKIVNSLTSLGQSGIMLLAMGGLLTTLHPAVALVLLVGSLPGVLVRLHFSRRTFDWQRERTHLERRSWYYHWTLTDAAHAKETRLFGLGELFRSRYREVREILRREGLRLGFLQARANLAVQVLSVTLIYGTYAFIGYRAVLGAITIGGLVMYFQAFQRGQGALNELLRGLSGLYEDNMFLTNVDEFMELRPRVEVPAAPRPIPATGDGILFDGVSFAYPSLERRVLEGVSFTIAPGEVVALVGANGSGKTTLVKLLCRLYEPTSGVVRFHGVDIREFDPVAWRRQFAVVFQDYMRYSMTVRENLWLGDVSRAIGDARIEEVARVAGADRVAARLPEGLDTMLGTWFEGGKDLSVGEWQKVALARAFVRDAPIVVLDEPTSALDPLAEHDFFEAFRRMLGTRSAIIVSHRLSTVRGADKIVVLEQGRVVECGRHEDLVARHGGYAGLFEAQAGAYR